MPTLEWNEHIRIVVSEMSWKQQLQASAEFLAWMSKDMDQQDNFAKQVSIVTLLILHSRVRVYRDDVLLNDGSHDIGDGVMMTLPLTKDGIEDLPGSLTQFLLKAAAEANPQVIANFYGGLMEMTVRLSATS